MPLLVDIGAYGAANGGGTIGTTIFEAQMPPDLDAGICLNEYGSEEPEYVLSTAGVYIEHPRFQVYCRHTDFTTGRALIETWYRLLAAVVNQTIGSTKYLRVEPLQSPFSLNPPQDALGRWEWFFNCRTEKELG
jgi:hypothetical protein